MSRKKFAREMTCATIGLHQDPTAQPSCRESACTICGTRMRPRKIHPEVVQERLGHSTIATTLDIYSHVLEGMQEETPPRSLTPRCKRP